VICVRGSRWTFSAWESKWLCLTLLRVGKLSLGVGGAGPTGLVGGCTHFARCGPRMPRRITKKKTCPRVCTCIHVCYTVNSKFFLGFIHFVFHIPNMALYKLLPNSTTYEDSVNTSEKGDSVNICNKLTYTKCKHPPVGEASQKLGTWEEYHVEWPLSCPYSAVSLQVVSKNSSPKMLSQKFKYMLTIIKKKFTKLANI